MVREVEFHLPFSIVMIHDCSEKYPIVLSRYLISNFALKSDFIVFCTCLVSTSPTHHLYFLPLHFTDLWHRWYLDRLHEESVFRLTSTGHGNNNMLYPSLLYFF